LFRKTQWIYPDLKTDDSKNINDYLAEAKGINKEKAKEMNDYVTGIANGVGLTYNFDKAVVANSFDAHRFSHLAKAKGLQDEAEEALFKAYFTDGKNTSDHETLAELGATIGLDPEAIRKSLSSNEFAEEVKKDIYDAYQIGVRGVPFFVFDDKYAVSGAQESDTFLGALTQAYTEHVGKKPALNIVGEDGEYCTPETC